MGRISFFFKEAFGSLWRNYFMTIAALVTVFLSIVVLGGVLVFVYTTDALLADVEGKVELAVYLQTNPDPTPDETASLQAEIMSWPEVKSVAFVSREDGLKRLEEDVFKDHPEVLDQFQKNMLPLLFEISLSDPHMVDTVAARFDDNPIVEDIRYNKVVAERLFSVTAQVRNFLVIFIVLQGIVAVLLISNTIRLSIFARKREVEIMRLVGATNWFIRWPFLIEGMFVGLVGAAAAAAVVLVLNTVLLGKISSALPFMTVPLDAVPYTLLILILLGVGIVIGVLGSSFGLRRLLKI